MQDIKHIKTYLLRHEHTQEELENLSEEELYTLYAKESKENMMSFFKAMNDESFAVMSALDEADIGDLTQKVRENASNSLKLIDVLKEGFDHFSYADIADILTLSVKNISAHKLQRILRIAYREFQEILLYRISLQLKGLPIEEYKVMMGHYEKKRNDVERLQKTIAELSDDKKREQILNMAHFKLEIVQNFMPSSIFNETYKEYLNNTPEKLKLVDEVLAITGMYSKKYLKNLPMQELEDMKEALLEDKRQDERDQKIFAQYTQMLDESMYGSDEQEFSDVCVKIITSLNQKQILMISEYLNAKNPVFLNRFNTLLRDFKKSLKS